MSERKLPQGLYCILGEEFSRGRTNIETAKLMVQGGAKIIQYREKENKTKLQKLTECREIRKITRFGGALFIVNDDIDIALLSEADGLHLGQDDIPVKEARKIAPGMMIGVSTHSPDQARLAMRDGADYIGVGPVFITQTKKDVVPAVGLEYVEFAATGVSVPWVAIGGIKEHNLGDVLARGAKTVCLVTGVLEAGDIPDTVRRLNDRILKGQ